MKRKILLFYLIVLLFKNGITLAQNNYLLRVEESILNKKCQLQRWNYSNGLATQTWSSGPLNIKSFAVGDVDNDGIEELVYAYDELFEVRDNFEAVPLITIYPIKIRVVGIHIADVDGDKINEIVIVPSISKHKAYIYKYGNTRFELVGNIENGWAFFLTIGDADNDGSNDLIFGGNTEIKIVSYDKTTNQYLTKKQISYSNGGLIDMAVAADLDNDGKNEIVAGGNKQKVFIWEHEGNDYSLAASLPVAGLSQAVNVADVNGDGKNELIYATSEYYLSTIEVLEYNNGNFKSNWKLSGENMGADIDGLSFRDINEDGIKDIVLTHNYKALGRFKSTVFAFNKTNYSFNQVWTYNSCEHGELFKTEFGNKNNKWVPIIKVESLTETINESNEVNLGLKIRNYGAPLNNATFELVTIEPDVLLKANKISNIKLASLDSVYTSYSYSYIKGQTIKGHSFQLNVYEGNSKVGSHDITTHLKGLPNYTHKTNSLKITFINNGLIGFDNNSNGDGLSYLGMPNVISSGGIIVGNENYGVRGVPHSSNDMSALNGIYHKANGIFDNISVAEFTDNNSWNPYNIKIKQRNYSTSNKDYIIIDYTLFNNSQSTLKSFYSGIYLDLDIVQYSSNNGEVLFDDNLVYQYHNFFNSIDKNIYGLSVLTKNGGASITDNKVFTVSNLFKYMTNTQTTTVSDNFDLRMFISSGPFDISPNDSVHTGFAIIGAKDLTDLKNKSHDATNTYRANITSVQGAGLNFSIPRHYHLFDNYPNPFNPTTKIKFEIPKTEFVTIQVYNILGEVVANVLNQEVNAGVHEVDIIASNYPSGVYICRMKAGSFSQSKKMLLLK